MVEPAVARAIPRTLFEEEHPIQEDAMERTLYFFIILLVLLLPKTGLPPPFARAEKRQVLGGATVQIKKINVSKLEKRKRTGMASGCERLRYLQCGSRGQCHPGRHADKKNERGYRHENLKPVGGFHHLVCGNLVPGSP
jgi:hypothetical protein